MTFFQKPVTKSVTKSVSKSDTPISKNELELILAESFDLQTLSNLLDKNIIEVHDQLRMALVSKSVSKFLVIIDFMAEARLPQYCGRWKTSMADQIHDLPDFNQVEREVLRIFRNFRIE